MSKDEERCAVNTTLVVRTNILPNRSVRIRVPESIPLGPANITLVITPEQKNVREPGGTAAELARSPLFGLWADRTDIVRHYRSFTALQAQEPYSRGTIP